MAQPVQAPNTDGGGDTRPLPPGSARTALGSAPCPGDGESVQWRPSPNRGPRRGADGANRTPTLIVAHYTGMQSPAAALERLSADGSGVSAHYQIDPDGTLHGLVPETERAWHAGVSAWAGEEDVNSASIGIELAHPGHRRDGSQPPFPEPQLRRLEGLLRALLARWDLGPEAVLAHSDVAPGRKIDPGEAFDWRRLARLGLALHPVDPQISDGGSQARDGVDAPGFAHALDQIGYGSWPEPARRDAFRRRFRPQETREKTTPQDVAVAQEIAAAFAAARQRRKRYG